MYDKHSKLVHDIMGSIERDCLNKTEDHTPVGEFGEYVYYRKGASEKIAEFLNSAVNKEGIDPL